MARSKNNDTFELMWRGLVVIPGFLGFWLGFKATHSIVGGGVGVAIGAGLGIGIIAAYRMAQDEKLKRSGINQVDKMTGKQFEHYLGHLFKSQGYSVQVTRESGDYGADLVLQKDGRRTVVQAKRYKQNVGIKAVQEAQASIAHYKAHQAWVVTNSDFTEAAITLAKSNGVRLISRSELVEMILAMKQGTSGSAVQQSGTPQTSTPSTASPTERKAVTCEKCGREMVLRRTTKGTAYVCKGYPNCSSVKYIS